MKWPVVFGVGAVAMLIGSILAGTTIRRDREFQRLIAEGDLAREEGRISVAIEALSGALALQGDSMLAHLKRGETYRQRGDWDAAVRDLTRAAALEPSAPRPLELLGDVHAATGRHAQAIDSYRRVLALDDRSPGVLYKLALAYYRNGDAVRAIEPLELAIAMEAGLSEAYYLLGVCLASLARVDAAVHALERAVELNGSFVAARAELARLEAARGMHRRQIEELEALAALEPTRAERAVAVANAYTGLGRMDVALATLVRAAERFPGHAAIGTAIGRLWLDEAEAGIDSVAATKAVEALQPHASRPGATGEALALYGRALFLAGRVRAAETVLQQATTAVPVEPIAYQYLAEAAERLSHGDIADEALRRFHVLTTN